jgi:hypothetical protein
MNCAPSLGSIRKEPHAALVDEGDLVEVHDAGVLPVPPVVLFPGRSEFANRRNRKAVMQNPSLFRSCFTETDFQHAVFPLQTGTGACFAITQAKRHNSPSL